MVPGREWMLHHRATLPPNSMKHFVYFLAVLLGFAQTTFAQTAPLNAPGGAVTVQSGSAGTIQPVPRATAKLPGSFARSTFGEAAPVVSLAGFGQFNDPLLNAYIEQGLSNSPNGRAALSRLEEARIRVRVAQSFLSPSLRSSALLTTQSLSEHRPLAIPNAADQLPRFQLNTFQVLPIDASYELDLFRRIRNGITVADLQAQATDADYQTFRLSLAADIARTYWLIRGNDAEQAAFRRNIQSRDTTLSILRERFRVGLISQIDVQRAQTDSSGLQVALRGLARARAELVNSLAQLCANETDQFAVPVGQLPESLPAYPNAPIEADQLTRRPDLTQVIRQGQVADALAVQQQSGIYPRINLVGQAGLLSGRFGSWFVPGSATFLVGINASIPLYEGHRARQSIALARQQAQTISQTYRQTMQLARRDAQTALDNLTILREQIELQQQTLILARRTERYNRELYVKGLSTYLEVLDAQRTVLANEQLLVQLRSQETQYVVALLRAVGGEF